jgi:hypothetical protein
MSTANFFSKPDDNDHLVEVDADSTCREVTVSIEYTPSSIGRLALDPATARLLGEALIDAAKHAAS